MLMNGYIESVLMRHKTSIFITHANIVPEIRNGKIKKLTRTNKKENKTGM